MTIAAHGEMCDGEALRLPRWWRYVLVAMATMILCSCSAPMVRLQSPDAEGVMPPAETAVEEMEAEVAPVPPVAQTLAVEVSTLKAMPLTMKSDLMADCPTCKT